MKATVLGTVPFLVLLAGCETIVYRTLEVKVPVPVPCTEPIPEAPAWPAETGRPANLVEKVGLLEAEIEQRRGYETRLVGTIKACRHDRQTGAASPSLPASP